MALLQPEKGGVEYSKLLPSTLLCGLRNGAIVILQLDFHTPEGQYTVEVDSLAC